MSVRPGGVRSRPFAKGFRRLGFKRLGVHGFRGLGVSSLDCKTFRLPSSLCPKQVWALRLEVWAGQQNAQDRITCMCFGVMDLQKPE